MTTKKKTAVLICPGRGTYGKAELGYLHTHHADKRNIFKKIDQYREKENQKSIWELDGSTKFSPKEHLPGENSAALIYGCSYADSLNISEEFDIVAVTGNSMGWYIALACAGVLNQENAIDIINTMGSQMVNGLIGGQLVYPEVDENWVTSSKQVNLLDEKIAEINLRDGCELYTSIKFGGLRVIGGTTTALRFLNGELPKVQDRFPFILPGNAAFHTPLLKDVSNKALGIFSEGLFEKPQIPMIDGRGHIWTPYSTSITDLWNYTLGHQVFDTYDFSKAIEVAIKEFAPDNLIVTGPGMSLGGAVAQVLIKNNYKELNNKNDFKNLQQKTPYVLAMADPDQRKQVISKKS